MESLAERQLFGEAPVEPKTEKATGSKEQAEPKEKRIKLMPSDTVPVKMLNPYGPNSINETPLGDLWSATKKGDLRARFHSELAADENSGGNYRIGIGVSRFAESTLNGIKALEEPKMAKILKPDVLKRALDEAEPLKKPLETLHAGKGSQTSGVVSLVALSKKIAAAKPVEKEEIEAAADLVYDWLKKPESVLRAMLNLLASNGAFYAAAVNEKVARACVHERPMDAATFKAAAWARASGAASSGEAPDDTKALTETE